MPARAPSRSIVNDILSMFAVTVCYQFVMIIHLGTVGRMVTILWAGPLKNKVKRPVLPFILPASASYNA
eukprot:6182977-Pleurochrysis_carterae.AAC.1